MDSKISIVIPTCKSENLVPCLESIWKYSDNVEIIAVCNGYDGVAPDGCIVVWHDEMIGYPAAVNEGIKLATGDYIVLLNDDTKLMDQPKNQWLEILLKPFEDPNVMITGPWLMYNTEIKRSFICFFCCMIRRELIYKIGLLDAKAFGFGYSEDVDYSCRAVDAGYKLAQVPDETPLTYDGRFGHGNFPIYHYGNQTFKDWPEGDKLLQHNHGILRQRYGINIENAKKLGEWMSDEELRWLAMKAKHCKVVIELGSWMGKSSTAIADNLPEDGVLYCVDTWAGSKAERETNHQQAAWMDGDYVFNEFLRNLWRHVEAGKLRPLRIHGVHAAKLLKDMGVKPDLIFIDAGHTYEEVKEDCYEYAKLMQPGTIISGHDYGNGNVGFEPWPGVKEAVDEVFGPNFAVNPGTSIWSTDFNPTPKIYDCFLFNNELEMLEERLKRLRSVVDYFVIVEAPETFSGRKKELIFELNRRRFENYPIIHVAVNDLPHFDGTEDSSWTMERFQRDAIMRGLTDCKDSDIIILGDVDEIPEPEAIRSFTGEIASLEMELYVGSMKVKATDPWLHCKLVRYRKLKEIGPCVARYDAHDMVIDRIPNGGKHLSYFGGVDTVIEKIHNSPHRNIDTPEFTDREHIRECLEKGLDLFKRDIKYEVVQ